MVVPQREIIIKTFSVFQDPSCICVLYCSCKRRELGGLRTSAASSPETLLAIYAKVMYAIHLIFHSISKARVIRELSSEDGLISRDSLLRSAPGTAVSRRCLNRYYPAPPMGYEWLVCYPLGVYVRKTRLRALGSGHSGVFWKVECCNGPQEEDVH